MVQGSLRFKFLLVFLGLVLAVMVPVGFILVRGAVRGTVGEAEAVGRGMAEGLRVPMVQAMLYREMGLAEEHRLLETSLRHVRETSNPSVVWALVADADGKVVSHTDPTLAGSDVVDLLHGELPRGDLRSTARTRDPESGREILEVAAPLHIGSRRLGTLALAVSLGELPRRAVLSAVQVSVIALSLAGLAFAGATLLSRRLVRPLDRLASEMDLAALVEGHRVRRIESRDEIGRLFDHFEAMLGRLRAAYRELDEARRQVGHSEKLSAVGRLAASLAHEINNPLDGIRNCVEEVIRNPQDRDLAARYLGLVREAVGQIEAVTRRLLEIARKPDPVKTDMDLADNLSGVFSLLEAQFRAKGVALVLSAAEEPVRFWGDPEQIRQVFINLLLNALDATPRGGRVEAALTRREGILIISIRDTGSGISEEQRRRIFEPFFSSKEGETGTGLGLTVSLGIIQDHGGEIHVGDRAGGGTAVDVHLPVRERRDHADPDRR